MRFPFVKAALAALLIGGGALAQAVNGTNFSSTIAVTSTFQAVFTSVNPSLNNCSIQNTGSNAMYVYFANQGQTIADATIAKSGKLAAGQSVLCGDSTSVLVNSVFITGTATDTYYAERW